MLSGILVAALWLTVLVLAMGERALTFASRAKMEDFLKRPAVRDRYLRWMAHPGPAVVSCVQGRVIAAVALLAMLLRNGLADAGTPVASAAAGAAALMGAELVGRYVGRRWSPVVIVILLPLLQLPALAVRPLHGLWNRFFEREPWASPAEVLEAAEEEIRVAIEDAASEGALQKDEMEMIEGVLEFRDVEVSEIMTPRTEIEWIDCGTALGGALEAIRGFLHSRIPLYEGTHDHVVGVVHVKDLLRATGEDVAAGAGLRQFMRDPFFVPETKRVVSLLREFKQKHAQIAMVLDEYGGVTGLVTIEDILEEIVGEIEDEFDREDHESRVRVLDAGTIDVDGRVHVDEVNELLDTDLPEDEDYDTVGGLVMSRFASVPQAGEETRFNGVLIRVLEGDSQRVRRVLLQKIEGAGRNGGQ
ncbi:MAG: hemolysin family protein [Candidatus Brocadiia bacterium]|nr:hemolysin family protein [Candidatus Brocadiia bacterium]